MTKIKKWRARLKFTGINLWYDGSLWWKFGCLVHFFRRYELHQLSWTLMDSHGGIFCTDSICLSKTPPLMDSHELSWTRMDSHGLTWTLMDWHGLSWTLMESHGLSWTLIDFHGLSWTLMNSHGLSWQDLMYRLKLSFQSSTSHGLSRTLMDAHGKILCTDSSCLFKTPPLMDSHGLSWQDLVSRLSSLS